MKQKSNISRYTICLCIGLAATLCAPNASAEDNIKNVSSSISCTLKITHISDGNSMRSSKFRIRLFGVDAPEKQWQCKDTVGRNWDCGLAAKKALEKLVSSVSQLSCTLMDVDRYGRLVMRCDAGKTDIATALVRDGMALAYQQYSKLYIQDEITAKKARTGVWSGSFIEPWTWRRSQ
ncbi:thermonuclease family protein [Candidatus Puniceispirillum sp.]|nr:thermonuclease family protein [Candidatus Puniceispirillum sp.]